MSYKSMLIHRCDIYRLVSQPDVVKFGVPQEVKPKYGAGAIALNVPCYFSKSTRSQASIIQGEPNSFIIETLNVHFLPGTDLQTNDKIVCDGEAYKAKLPRNIRKHHIEVEVERIENL